ncbi:TonB-dependent receptor [Gammaproteobacteria bacterium]|nr:TonB-dependent receptor [Gammaproteobacteria bacterium]MDA9307272.1 TonB-dependent receptor [Gammaproteobacteria bacterium]MDB0069765.1 TonB-dependent receptor [Gammaproteobacteria bacterium]MDB2665784.1 TonB-dependent receptor [Gammaproteobacteria bacterium]MDB4194696.1 TonB-dependent receptor [Gammaproteobacteria bacterium]
MNITKSFLALTCFAFLSFNANAQQDIEEVMVTGSYIKGSATDGASPVEVIDREEIENIGAVSIADITRNLSVNSGSENASDSFTQGATQGTSNVNLRGLGLSSTLILIDGRRQTLTGATANDGSAFVNTNAIPVVALERVEVLKEGAAAVYGSDAVAGVVNYIFRRDFTGVEFEMSSQEADISGQTDDRVSVIWGAENGNTNFVLAASILDRSPMSGADFDPSLAQLGISGLGTSFLLFGPSTVASGPYAGTYTPFQNVPSPTCVADQGILIPQASGSRCGFVYGPRFNVVNDEDHTSMYGSFKTLLANGNGLEIDYMSTAIDVNDNPQSPSYPALSYLSPANAIMPGTGGNPFGVPVLWLGRALGSAYPSPNAPREIETDRFSIGLNGEFDNGFDWDAHYTVSSEDLYGQQPDTSTSKFSAAIKGNGGSAGNQTWDLFTPSNNSADLIKWISTNQQTWTSTELSVFDFLMTGSIGDIDIASGLQFRDESFDVARGASSIAQFDAAGNITQPADLLFLGGGLESTASRNATALFIEGSMNPSDRLEVKGALRYEDLESDSSVDPKIAFRYQASDELALRASFSTSFREASLAQLTSTNISLQGIQDYNADGSAKGGTAFIRIAQANNPNLAPEESENMNIGAMWNPTDKLSMKLDYWAIDYTNVITIESAQGKVAANPLDSDVKRTAGGTLTGVTTKYFNAANVNTSGLDFESTYDFDTSFGQAQVGVNMMHMFEYEIPVGNTTKDVVGLFNHDNFARSLPDTKAVFHAALNSGNNSLSLFGRYTGDYKTTRPLDATATARGFSQSIDSFFTVDLMNSYLVEMNDSELKLSLGITNMFDEEVPLVYDAANWSYDAKHHDPRGRMIYIGFKLSR